METRCEGSERINDGYEASREKGERKPESTVVYEKSIVGSPKMKENTQLNYTVGYSA